MASFVKRRGGTSTRAEQVRYRELQPRRRQPQRALVQDARLDHPALATPVVDDDAAVGVEDQVTLHGGQFEIGLELDPVIFGSSSRRPNVDDDDRVIDCDGVAGRRGTDDERGGDEGEVVAYAHGEALDEGLARRIGASDRLMQRDRRLAFDLRVNHLLRRQGDSSAVMQFPYAFAAPGPSKEGVEVEALTGRLAHGARIARKPLARSAPAE